MIAYKLPTFRQQGYVRLAQETPAPAAQATKTVPPLVKIGLGLGLVVVGVVSTFKQYADRPAARQKSFLDLMASAGAIVGGLWIGAEGFGLKL